MNNSTPCRARQFTPGAAVLLAAVTSVGISSTVSATEKPAFTTSPIVASPLRVDVDRLAPIASASVPLVFDAESYAALRDHHAVQLDGFPLAPTARGQARRSVRLDLRRSSVDGSTTFVAATVVDGAIVETPMAAPDVQIFRGTVVGEPGSFAYVAFSPHGTHGYVRTNGVTQIVSPGPFGDGRAPLVYNLDALPAGAVRWRDFVCQTQTNDGVAWPDNIWAPAAGEGGIAGGAEPPCRRIEMAIDTDKEFTDNLFAGNLDASAAYAVTLLGATSEISERDVNASFDVTFVRVWTGSDPWTAGGTQSQLFEFRDHWNANMTHVDRHLAHYLSGRGLGGGVAWLSAVCHPSNAYGLSANLNGSFPYPLQDNVPQNWDPFVVAHEIGHNIGTSHTHDYCPPLDQCAASQFFGNCQDQRVCTSQGTIMSYCHTCNGGMTNIVLEFHPVVRQTIINYLSSVGNCYIGCVAQADIILVPQDSPSIQEAIVAVNPGGQVIVSPGTYNETIRPFGKPVTIRSTDGPAVTIIDATGLGGSVARFSSSESFQTVLEGFTLTGGTGSQVNLGGTNHIVGGGIYVSGATPKIVDCVIVGNSATFGGGIFNSNASPTFENCVIADNTSNPSSGGGVFNFSNSSPQFIACVFTGNHANVNGGAMSNQNSSPVVIDGTFIGNSAGSNGGALRNIQNSAGQFTGCTFVDNSAGGTGGAAFNDNAPNTSIGNSSFCGSSPDDITGAYQDAGGNTFAESCSILGDLNGDGIVDGADLGILLASWGDCAGCPEDLDGNGVVDGSDLGVLLSNWTG